MLAYRSIPAQVRERLGRGNAAVAFMRLGNAEDAKVAAEQIGTEHRFVLSQLTDTVGASVTGTSGWSYTSTVATADSVSVSASTSQTAGRSRGRGHTTAGAAPFGARSQRATRSPMKRAAARRSARSLPRADSHAPVSKAGPLAHHEGATGAPWRSESGKGAPPDSRA